MTLVVFIRADFRFAHNQWETSLQSNAVSHWLGANLESALFMYIFPVHTTSIMNVWMLQDVHLMCHMSVFSSVTHELVSIRQSLDTNDMAVNTDQEIQQSVITSSNGSFFRVTGPLCGEFTGPLWIPHTKASDAKLWCFLWFAPE